MGDLFVNPTERGKGGKIGNLQGGELGILASEFLIIRNIWASGVKSGGSSFREVKYKMKNYISGALLGLFIGLSTGSVLATPTQVAVPEQAATPTPAPTLSETELVIVQLLSTQAKLASGECNNLESMKTFVATRTDAIKRIETAHPGFTLDLNTGKLAAKKVTTPAPGK